MGDQLNYPCSNRNSSLTGGGVATRRKGSPRNFVLSRAKGFPKCMNERFGNASSQMAVFILKLAALEMVRRVSTAKCPFVWQGIQLLQLICYPPLKWIQKWYPFKDVGRGMKALSRPLLVLSIATTFSDLGELRNELSNATGLSPPSHSEPQSDTATSEAVDDTRISGDDDHCQLVSENWLAQLHEELEKQGINMPDRINEDDLRRFYAAANGNFPSFLSSVKKTIRWRETYGILSLEELETWSQLIFWHGYDLKDRPCLIVRLGLACSNLPWQDRPRFAQAVVSQVEHGVHHLVGPENPEITVLVDCEGLSPIKVPMQIIRSCSMVLQNHYPNRLGCLFVIRLPPVVRVISQTFLQMLKPTTRKKFKVEGEAYHKILLEHLQILPSYLGGRCECRVCSSMSTHQKDRPYGRRSANAIQPGGTNGGDDDNETFSHGMTSVAEFNNTNGTYEQVLRTAIVGLLMLWLLLVLIAGIVEKESRPILPLWI